MRVAAMLGNGFGGYDWGPLMLACTYHRVEDLEGVIDRLLVIREHHRTAANEEDDD